MKERETARVESEPLKTFDATPPVQVVSQYWIPDVCHMYPDLVCSAGMKTQLETGMMMKRLKKRVIGP